MSSCQAGHKRRKVLNTRACVYVCVWGGGGKGSEYTLGGQGGTFSLAVNWSEPPPPISAKNNYISHFEN